MYCRANCCIQLRAGFDECRGIEESIPQPADSCEKGYEALQGQSGVLVPSVRHEKHVAGTEDSGPQREQPSHGDTSVADELRTPHSRSDHPGEERVITVSGHNVRRAFRRVNTWKAEGPDSFSCCAFEVHADHLSTVFMTTFEHSLAHSVIPSTLQKSTLVPVPKLARQTSPNE